MNTKLIENLEDLRAEEDIYRTLYHVVVEFQLCATDCNLALILGPFAPSSCKEQEFGAFSPRTYTQNVSIEEGDRIEKHCINQ